MALSIALVIWYVLCKAGSHYIIMQPPSFRSLKLQVTLFSEDLHQV